jgi:lipopolysaccharide biosynthesis glycosyltransferase
MKIAASVLFDSSYLESALVTAFEASRRSEVLHTLYLIYLDRGTEEDAQVHSLLAGFVAACTGAVAIKAIVIANTLPDFKRHHFNNSIVYKPLIPSILPADEKFVLNLDAGILLGNDFDPFVTQLADTLCQPEATWVIAANNGEAPNHLTAALQSLPHHALYPDAAVMLFNLDRWRGNDWNTRYLDAYPRLHQFLRYAEQELICLMAQPEELVDLPVKDPLQFHFLSESVLNGSRTPLPRTQADDCIFFKFKGSIKPWKYWVLDPDKAIYTRRRQRMEQVFPIAGGQVIESERFSCMHNEWAAQFLMVYDAQLLDPVAEAA